MVLYLYIYIALLAVHTNQKRFQCKRPREKRAVLRERKEALGSPVNKVEREEGRSWFQSEVVTSYGKLPESGCICNLNRIYPKLDFQMLVLLISVKELLYVLSQRI